LLDFRQKPFQEYWQKACYIVLEEDEFAGFEKMFTANRRKSGSCTNQIRSSAPLLARDYLSSPFDVSWKRVDRPTLFCVSFGESENDSGIVDENEGLVKKRWARRTLTHGLLTLLIARPCGPTPTLAA